MYSIKQLRTAYEKGCNVYNEVEQTDITRIPDEEKEGLKQVIIWLKECINMNKLNDGMEIESEFTIQCGYHQIIFESLVKKDKCIISSIKHKKIALE